MVRDRMVQVWVFSAHAEVVPHGTGNSDTCYGILRARGGSSEEYGTETVERMYSPRTRR